MAAGKFNFNYDKAVEDIKNTNKKQSFKDERFWEVEKDKKSGKGIAVIRFIPTIKGEVFSEYFQHFFPYFVGKASKKWYVDYCLTTLKKDCPICDKNKELWDTGLESDKDTARSRKRIKKYVSNICVVKDLANPENEGKVFLFKYGIKIMEKLQSVMIEDEEQKKAGIPQKIFVPFNLYDGANFNLILKTVEVDGEKMTSYDDCKFDDQAPFQGGDDKKIEKYLKQTYSLGEFVDENNYPKYDATIKKLRNILGDPQPSENSVTKENVDSYENQFFEEEKVAAKATATASTNGDVDEDEAFFDNLK